jgi:hypothetical protein
MKHLTITSLELINIAGIDNQAIDLSNDTSITGSNGTGKTTIAHAVAWLLTGKDLTGSSKWAIKPRDAEGNDVIGLDTIVKAWVSLDGSEPFSLCKQMQENWEYPKSTASAELTGHNYYYYINGLPYQSSEWKQWLTDNITHPDTIRMLLTPHAFHNMHWQKRRDTLLSLLNIPKDAEIAETLGLSITDALNTQSAKDLSSACNKKLKNIDNTMLMIDAAKQERKLDASSSEYSTRRVKELEGNRSEQIMYRATIQQQIDEADRVQREKAQCIQDSLAQRFSPLRFKVFDRHGDQTCQTLLYGREWSELSQGEKIKAGLRFISQLQEEFGLVLPILIDEHESVADTTEWPMPDPQGQKIRFYHEPNKALSINNK